MSLNCPDMQFPVKQSSRDMANPTIASWRMLKKISRYLVGVRRIVWRFKWQEESKFCKVYSDSDWGGNCRDRQSTSGGSVGVGRALY
eukprot:8736389-Karenia_brevis.AAC.1